MANFDFADRYAEAGIAPTAQTIASRQAAAERIVADATAARILLLAEVYYESPGLDLTWLRDEFAKEDPTFSLINNERETRVLAAAMLGALIAIEHSVAILAVITGSVSGHRSPVQAGWLLRDAEEALGRIAVADRKPRQVQTRVGPTTTAKLGEEVAGLAQNDWAGLLTVLGKIRTESTASARTTSAQVTAALEGLSHQIALQREESQILWWLVGGHSRSLERTFAAFAPAQAAIVGAIDLGSLTSVTELGPVAAPAILERVVALAKRPKGATPRNLAIAVDGLLRDDLKRLPAIPNALSPRLAPVSASLALAKLVGAGAWHQRFLEETGLDAAIDFEPVALATQLYRENLLGQLL